MWKAALENSALVLGLAISLYTVYSVVAGIVAQRRERRALLGHLKIRFEYFITLAESFAERAQKVFEKHHVDIPSAAYVKLPDAAKEDVAVLLLRASHLIEFEISWDSEKIGAILNEQQIAHFLQVMKQLQVFREVFTVRANELKLQPDNAAALSRLSTVAGWNLATLKEQYQGFKELVYGKRVAREDTRTGDK